jgi:beta-glucosidase
MAQHDGQEVTVSPAISPVLFPDGFVWGAATAAYQIEGSVAAGGRGPSIWDTFSHQPGRTCNGDTGDVACDHYRRVDEDLDLMARLGLSAYRFSVAWPRIQPDGKGPALPEGLDFYRRLVDGLRERDITPVATLYHWDLPQALEDSGGWTERDTSERFAEYAAIVADALGDRVGMWVTLNEPWCSAWAGYGQGRHAPGRRDIAAGVSATHHLLLGHGSATQAIRAIVSGPVGITLNLSTFRSASDHPDDRAATARAEGNFNRLFLEPVFHGRYPADMAMHYPGLRPDGDLVAPGDLEAIAQPLDFLGINYYSPQHIADPARVGAAQAAGYSVRSQRPDPVADDLRFASIRQTDAEETTMGWEIEPAALTELLGRVRQGYTQVPIYITENGAAYCDYVAPDGAVRDPERIAYLDGHLRAVHAAIDDGVDVRGYFVWSLMDNFEWSHGYAHRFGLIWVDYPSGRRIPKTSFEWYRRVIQSTGLPDLAGE